MIGSLRDEQTKGWQRFGVIYNKKGKRGRDGGEYVMWSKLVVCDVNVRAQRKRRAFGVYVNAHLCSTVAPSVTLPQVVHTWCNKYKISCVHSLSSFHCFSLCNAVELTWLYGSNRWTATAGRAANAGRTTTRNNEAVSLILQDMELS